MPQRATEELKKSIQSYKKVIQSLSKSKATTPEEETKKEETTKEQPKE